MPSFIRYWDFEDGLQGWTGSGIAYNGGLQITGYHHYGKSPLVDLSGYLNKMILALTTWKATYDWFVLRTRVYDKNNNKIAEAYSKHYRGSNIYFHSVGFRPQNVTEYYIQEYCEGYYDSSKGVILFAGFLDWDAPQDALVEQVIFSFTDKVRSYDAPIPTILAGEPKHVLQVIVNNKQMQSLSQAIIKPDGSELGWGFTGYTSALTVQNVSPIKWRIKTQSNANLQQITFLDGKLYTIKNNGDISYIANMKTYILSNPFSPGNYSTSLVSPNADNSVDFDKTIVLDFLAKTINIFNLKLIPEVSTTLNPSDFTQLEVQVTVKDNNGNELGTSTIDLLNSSSTTGSPITIPKDLDGQHLEVDIRLIARGTITQEGNVAVSFTVASELPQ